MARGNARGCGSGSMVERLEQRTLLAAALPGDPYAHAATLEFGGKTKAIFMDADGDLVTLSLSGPGTGTVRFNQTTDLETSLDAASVELHGTTNLSSLSVKIADKTSKRTVPPCRRSVLTGP